MSWVQVQVQIQFHFHLIFIFILIYQLDLKKKVFLISSVNMGHLSQTGTAFSSQGRVWIVIYPSWQAILLIPFSRGHLLWTNLHSLHNLLYLKNIIQSTTCMCPCVYIPNKPPLPPSPHLTPHNTPRASSCTTPMKVHNTPP